MQRYFIILFRLFLPLRFGISITTEYFALFPSVFAFIKFSALNEREKNDRIAQFECFARRR